MALMKYAAKQHIALRATKQANYSDLLAAGVALQSGAVSLQDDLNALRSQTKRILGMPAWTSALSNRSLAGLDTAIDALSNSTRLYRVDVNSPIVVGAGQNFQILSAVGGETPSQTAAVGAVSTEGAVVVVHPATFGTHDLAALAGTNALGPKNLVVVVDSTLQDPILSAGKVIYGLVQSQSAVDGHTFDDVAARLQVSFVRVNATGTALEAVPFADIAGKSINYSYVTRAKKVNLPEDAFIGGSFVDSIAAVDVTLNNAIDNQVGPATQIQAIDINMSDAVTWAFRDAASANLFKVLANSAGISDVEIAAATDTFSVNAAATNVLNGASFDTAGIKIDVGLVAGTIERASDLLLRATGAGVLRLSDSFNGPSTWVGTDVPLAGNAADWSTFKANFGEVALLNAISQAKTSSGRVVEYALATVDIAAGVNITGVGGGANISRPLPDHSAVAAFRTQAKGMYDNDELVPGNSVADTEADFYPGTTPANGDIICTFDIEAGDVIRLEVFGV